MGGIDIDVAVFDKNGNVLSDSASLDVEVDPKNPMKTVEDAKEKMNTFINPSGSISRTDPKTGLFGYYIPETGTTIVLKSISLPLFGNIYNWIVGTESIEEMLTNKATEAANEAIGKVFNSLGIPVDMEGAEQADPKQITVSVQFKLNNDRTLHSSIYSEAFRLFLVNKNMKTTDVPRKELEDIYIKEESSSPGSFVEDVYVGANEEWRQKVQSFINDAAPVNRTFPKSIHPDNQNTQTDKLPIKIGEWTLSSWISEGDNATVYISKKGLTCGAMFVALTKQKDGITVYMTYNEVLNTVDAQRRYIKGKLEKAKTIGLLSKKKFSSENSAVNEESQALDSFVKRNKDKLNQMASENKFLL